MTVTTMPDKVLAKVILITKDENALVGDFLQYYGALFGAENVLVIDNGSSADSPVHQAYHRHVEAGGEVRLDTRPFRDAVNFMSEHMQSLRETCEFILPLETDEFIFLPDRGENHVPSRLDLQQLLRALPDDVSVVRYGSFVCSSVDPKDSGYSAGAYSRPVVQMTRFHDQGWDKIIVRASAFETMTQWCHHARCSRGTKIVHPGLGLLHFHHTGIRRHVERSIPVITSYGYVDTRMPLSEQLRAVAPLVDAPIACGHKLNCYAKHIRRLAVLQSFRMRIGRLPNSVLEMEQYAGHDVPDEAVRAAIMSGALTVACHYAVHHGPSWDDLLYDEPRQDGDIQCSQVRNFFLQEAAPRTDDGPAIRWLDMVPEGVTEILLVGNVDEVRPCADALRQLMALASASIDWVDLSATEAISMGIRRVLRFDPDCQDSLRMLHGYDVVVDARRAVAPSKRANLLPVLFDRTVNPPTYILVGTEDAKDKAAIARMRREGGGIRVLVL